MPHTPKPPESGKGRKGPNHGGARPGAGPKPGDLSNLRRDIERQIAEGLMPYIPGVVATLVLLARGVNVKEKGPDGTNIVYTTPPNLAAIKEIFDRTAGKARQLIDIDPGAIDMRTAVALTRAAAEQYSDPDDGADDDGDTGPDG